MRLYAIHGNLRVNTSPFSLQDSCHDHHAIIYLLPTSLDFVAICLLTWIPTIRLRETFSFWFLFVPCIAALLGRDFTTYEQIVCTRGLLYSRNMLYYTCRFYKCWADIVPNDLQISWLLKAVPLPSKSCPFLEEQHRGENILTVLWALHLLFSKEVCII